MAPSGATMAETPESGCRTGDRRSQFGGRERSAGGEVRAHPVFQPSIGTTHRNRCRVDTERFSSGRPWQSGGWKRR